VVLSWDYRRISTQAIKAPARRGGLAKVGKVLAWPPPALAIPPFPCQKPSI